MSKLILAAVAALALTTGANATSVTIDFDGLDASPGQDIPLENLVQDGLEFSLSFTGNNLGPALFDTTVVGPALNGDGDLVPAVQGENGVGGNVLILQENDPSAIPDDSLLGGTITFTLESVSVAGFDELLFEQVSVVDDGDFEVFAGAGTAGALLGAANLGSDSETAIIDFLAPLSLGVGDSFTFDFNGASGGFDALEFSVLTTPTPVPLPAAVWMLLAGVGGLVAMRRRKRNA